MPLRLFYSYSHRDERLLQGLRDHLSLLRRQGLIQEWHDRDINAGQEWASAIDYNLETAHIILLLVSASFLSSDYCYSREMKRALERHTAGEARVIPIILRPVNWTNSPIGKLQALPADGRPVTTWRNRDAAWVDVARGIAKAITELSDDEGRDEATDESIVQSIGSMPSEDTMASLFTDCITGRLIHILTKPPWLTRIGTDYRVILPLKGDPIAHNIAQFPPPAEDTLVWVDLSRYESPGQVPANVPRREKSGLYDLGNHFFVDFLPGDPVYVVQIGGYRWFTLSWTIAGCLDRARGWSDLTRDSPFGMPPSGP